MKRSSCIPHGADEVLVCFVDDAGAPKNHLLREVPELAGRYAAHDAMAKKHRETLESQLAGERATIDKDAFAMAEIQMKVAAEPTPTAAPKKKSTRKKS